MDTLAKKRHTSFNIKTNKILETINTCLVNDSPNYPPNYIHAVKNIDKLQVRRIQTMLDSVTSTYEQDKTLGSILYKLYLCQALFSYINDDGIHAAKGFEEALEFVDSNSGSMIEYYRDIVQSTGVRLSAIVEDDTLASSRIASRFAGWTDDEFGRYLWLRSTEWSAWPCFIAMGIGQFTLLFLRPVPALIGLSILNLLWSFMCLAFVSVKLAGVGVWINKLKWVTSPGVALVFAFQHSYILAGVALVWPLLSMLVQFPGTLLQGAIGGLEFRAKIEDKMLKQLQA